MSTMIGNVEYRKFKRSFHRTPSWCVEAELGLARHLIQKETHLSQGSGHGGRERAPEHQRPASGVPCPGIRHGCRPYRGRGCLHRGARPGCTTPTPAGRGA